MHKPTIAFFTVTRSRDYDYVLGSIEHHARMGRHVILDTTLPEHGPKTFRGLPPSVTWIHEPIYGCGWKEFRYVASSQRALEVAASLKTDVLVWLDSDEFFSEDFLEDVAPQALFAVIEVQCIHWRKDGHSYLFGESEWHTRIWPRWANLRVGINSAWAEHKDYNGNPEHHAIVHVAPNLPKMKILSPCHHHVHYAVGAGRDDDETAQTTVDGWQGGGRRVPDVAWPAKLALWRFKGINPSESFL